MFRVIIAGGRDFTDYALLSKTMDEYLSSISDDISIVCGQARGADTLGESSGNHVFGSETGTVPKGHQSIRVLRHFSIANITSSLTIPFPFSREIVNIVAMLLGYWVRL